MKHEKTEQVKFCFFICLAFGQNSDPHCIPKLSRGLILGTREGCPLKKNWLGRAGTVENIEHFWNGSHAIPMQRPFFLPKLSYHRIVSLPVYSQILFFSFCQKTNLHLYKRSRLSLYLFTFFRRFSIKISCHNMFQFLKLHQMIRHKLNNNVKHW